MVDVKSHRINDKITAREVRVIDSEGNQLGVLSISEAQALANEAELDLVEIVPTEKPPVCRIMNFGKFKFEQSKKAHQAKRNQKQVQLKEIKLRPGTDDGDYQVKLRNLIRFLEDGDKAKVTMRFRGREMAHQDLGFEFLKRVQKDLEEHGTVEQYPKLEGRQMIMVLGPKKK
ncbi:MAG: translation initiation factor IF-3 [Gammaproteobacteria bacterium]|nr:translation initiation factor IF-3 [Gammaproteobacteria bacterium]